MSFSQVLQRFMWAGSDFWYDHLGPGRVLPDEWAVDRTPEDLHIAISDWGAYRS